MSRLTVGMEIYRAFLTRLVLSALFAHLGLSSPTSITLDYSVMRNHNETRNPAESWN